MKILYYKLNKKTKEKEVKMNKKNLGNEVIKNP